MTTAFLSVPCSLKKYQQGPIERCISLLKTFHTIPFERYMYIYISIIHIVIPFRHVSIVSLLNVIYPSLKCFYGIPIERHTSLFKAFSIHQIYKGSLTVRNCWFMSKQAALHKFHSNHQIGKQIHIDINKDLKCQRHGQTRTLRINTCCVFFQVQYTPFLKGAGVCVSKYVSLTEKNMASASDVSVPLRTTPLSTYIHEAISGVKSKLSIKILDLKCVFIL